MNPNTLVRKFLQNVYDNIENGLIDKNEYEKLEYKSLMQLYEIIIEIHIKLYTLPIHIYDNDFVNIYDNMCDNIMQYLNYCDKINKRSNFEQIIWQHDNGCRIHPTQICYAIKNRDLDSIIWLHAPPPADSLRSAHYVRL